MAKSSDFVTSVIAQELKEKGNAEFNKNNWSDALSHYTNALQLIKEENAEKGVCYKNRAAVYLKLKDYEEVIEDCDSALKICCNKALYRRCQALEALGRFEEAYRDAEMIISSDPNNKLIQPIATRLREIVQEHRKENVSQMLDLASNMRIANKKRENAMINLLVLARNEAGAEEIFKKEGVSKIAHLLKVEKNEKVICSAILIVSELCKSNFSRTEFVMKYVGLPLCLKIMNSTSAERVNASQYCLQNVLNTYSGMTNEPDSKPEKALCELHKKEINEILSCLLNNITNKTITGLARDALIQLITRNIGYSYTALNWAKRLVELGGLQRLMEVASQLKKYKYESLMDITFSTRDITSVCLAKIYENVYNDDDARKKFIYAIDEFIKDKLFSPDTESKVHLVLAITTLIYGPLDVANTIIFKERIFEILFAMSKTMDVLQQKVVCECIVAAVTKYNEANVFIRRGVKILENLYQSKDDSIRIRALVGLCRLTTFKDALCSPTITLFPDGAMKKLAKICRRFLIDPKKDKDMKKWAIKGLSYLTFDDDVKEELIEDKRAVQAMIELTKTDDQSVLYAVLTTLINFCNAYVEQEHIPEMIDLVRFSVHHFPEEFDVDNYGEYDIVRRRLCVLAKTGMISALVNLARTDSQNIKELVSRVFNVMCHLEGMGEMVAQLGGTKALVSLALSGTDKVKKAASEALITLGLWVDPGVAFPGQIIMEVVRPIINFLNPECPIGFKNLAGLSVLCELAKVNDRVREHIFKEGVFQKIEAFLNKEDTWKLLSVTALKLINILLTSREVAIQCFKQDNSRVKYLVLLCKENREISGLAAAALVQLMTANKEACEKIFDSESWLISLRFLLTNPDGDIKELGIIIVINMMESTKDVAAKLIETDIMDLLRALKSDTVQNKKIEELASIALEAAAERSNGEERREELVNMVRSECDRARRSGQLGLLYVLQMELDIYQHLEFVSKSLLRTRKSGLRLFQIV